MDQNLVYSKTALGDEAVRQSTRVVQRNLRLVLVQVDGKVTVGDLAAKVGNAKLVENALRELEEGGFIVPALEASSAWGKNGSKPSQGPASIGAIPRFSTFGPKSVLPGESPASAASVVSAFSGFEDPLTGMDDPPEPVVAVKQKEIRTKKATSSTKVPFRFKPIMAVWGLIGAIVLLGLGIVFFPYNNYKPAMEAALGQSLKTSVRIGTVNLAFLPRPALVLQRVSIGDKENARIEEVRIPSLFSLLSSGRRSIAVVEASGITLPAEGLAVLAGMAQGSANMASGYSLGRADIKRLSIEMGDAALRNLDGALIFKGDGRLDKLQLQTEDRRLKLDAVPTADGTALQVDGQGWKPLESAPYVFDAIQAKGLVQKSKLVLQGVEATFLGGKLQGNALLDWSNGMAMAGEGTFDRLNARRVSEATAPALKIDGVLSGSFRMRGTGETFASMWSSLEGSADFDVARGVLTGVDLGEAARQGAGKGVRGGATKFDHLRGILNIDPRMVTGKDVRMEAGVVTASGHFVATKDRKVDGSFDVSIGGSAMNVRMPVRLTGMLPDINVAVGH